MKLDLTRKIGDHNLHGEVVQHSLDSAMLAILAMKQYAKPVYAAIREWVTNACESHVEAGKADVPFELHVESVGSGDDVKQRDIFHIKVRDFGIGMTDEFVRTRFFSLGQSTKRSKADVGGAFGLGAKAALAVSDMVLVSCYDGAFVRSYVGYLDEDHNIRVRAAAVTHSDEPPGVALSMTVKKQWARTARVNFEPVFEHSAQGWAERFGEEPEADGDRPYHELAKFTRSYSYSDKADASAEDVFRVLYPVGHPGSTYNAKPKLFFNGDPVFYASVTDLASSPYATKSAKGGLINMIDTEAQITKWPDLRSVSQVNDAVKHGDYWADVLALIPGRFTVFWHNAMYTVDQQLGNSLAKVAEEAIASRKLSQKPCETDPHMKGLELSLRELLKDTLVRTAERRITEEMRNGRFLLFASPDTYFNLTTDRMQLADGQETAASLELLGANSMTEYYSLKTRYYSQFIERLYAEDVQRMGAGEINELRGIVAVSLRNPWSFELWWSAVKLALSADEIESLYKWLVENKGPLEAEAQRSIINANRDNSVLVAIYRKIQAIVTNRLLDCVGKAATTKDQHARAVNTGQVNSGDELPDVIVVGPWSLLSRLVHHLQTYSLPKVTLDVHYYKGVGIDGSVKTAEQLRKLLGNWPCKVYDAVQVTPAARSMIQSGTKKASKPPQLLLAPTGKMVSDYRAISEKELDEWLQELKEQHNPPRPMYVRIKGFRPLDASRSSLELPYVVRILDEVFGVRVIAVRGANLGPLKDRKMQDAMEFLSEAMPGRLNEFKRKIFARQCSYMRQELQDLYDAAGQYVWQRHNKPLAVWCMDRGFSLNATKLWKKLQRLEALTVRLAGHGQKVELSASDSVLLKEVKESTYAIKLLGGVDSIPRKFILRASTNGLMKDFNRRLGLGSYYYSDSATYQCELTKLVEELASDFADTIQVAEGRRRTAQPWSWQRCAFSDQLLESYLKALD